MQSTASSGDLSILSNRKEGLNPPVWVMSMNTEMSRLSSGASGKKSFIVSSKESVPSSIALSATMVVPSTLERDAMSHLVCSFTGASPGSGASPIND